MSNVKRIVLTGGPCAGKTTFVVCDRGTLDISAYIDKAMWNDITGKCGTSTDELRDICYFLHPKDIVSQHITAFSSMSSTREFCLLCRACINDIFSILPLYRRGMNLKQHSVFLDRHSDNLF